MYKITYTYDNPSGAGPFKGRAVVDSKHSKGDSYYGPFGRATVTTCSKVKTCPMGWLQPGMRAP